MMTKRKSLQRTQSETEQPTGFRIDSDGVVEVLTLAETENLIGRAMCEAMVGAGFRIHRTKRRLH
jgi:hypothetical protein